MEGGRGMNVEEFNKAAPVGSKVIYINDFGDHLHTSTRSEAWEMCGSGVVQIEGSSGCYDIDRIVIDEPTPIFGQTAEELTAGLTIKGKGNE